MEDCSDTASNKSYMLVNAKGPNFSKSIVMPLGYNTNSTMNTQPHFNKQWCPPASQRYYSRDMTSTSARSVADFRTGNVQRYPSEGRCASPMSVRSNATTASVKACAFVEALRCGEFNIVDQRMIYKEFCRFFKSRRSRKSYRRHIKQLKARRFSRDDTSDESSDHNSDSSDCMSIRTVRTSKSMPRNVYEGSKVNMRTTLHNVRNDIKNGNIFSDRSVELRYNSLKKAVSGRFGNAYLDTSDSEPDLVSESTENVSRIHRVGSKNDFLQNVASVPNKQSEKPMTNNNATRKNISQKTNAFNHTWATQKERFENSWANNNSLHTSQRSRFENFRKAISAQSSVHETTKQTDNLNINKENTSSTNTSNGLSLSRASKRTGGSCDDQSSNKENAIQINNVQKQYNPLLTDSEEEIFPKKKGIQNKTSVGFDVSQMTNNAKNKASSVRSVSKKVDADNFKVPHVPTRKPSMRKGEKLIAKSSQPLDSLIEISPEKQQSAHSDFSVFDTDRSTEVSSRPSFTKRKLFSTKLSMIENANASTENSANSPNDKMYSAMSNVKNKTKKIAKNQSCLTRDINENEDVMDLLGKLMPGKNINQVVASKTNVKEDHWDAQSILSQYNGSDVSETFTDCEDEILEYQSNRKGNKENNVSTLPATSVGNSKKSNKSTKKPINDVPPSSSKSKTEIEQNQKNAKSKKYIQDKKEGNTTTANPMKNGKQKPNKESQIPLKMCTVNVIDVKAKNSRCVGGNGKQTNTNTVSTTPTRKSPRKLTPKKTPQSKDDINVYKEKLHSPSKLKKNSNGVNIKLKDTRKDRLNKSNDSSVVLNVNNDSLTMMTRKRSRMQNETLMNLTINSDTSFETNAKRLKEKQTDKAKSDSRCNSLNGTFNMTLRPRRNRSSNLSTISDPTTSMSTFSRFNRSLRSRQADILAFFKS